MSEQRLTRSEVILDELLFRVKQLFDCNGWKESRMDECICFMYSPVREAALYLEKKGIRYDIPEVNIKAGKSTVPEYEVES